MNDHLYPLFPEIYHPYVPYLESDDIIAELNRSLKLTLEFIKTIPPDKLEYAYAPQKWTIKEVMRHIIDTERIYTYRALRFSRMDATPIEGFDEAVYISNLKSCNFDWEDLIEEYQIVRQATLSLFKPMTPEMLDFKGIANNLPIATRVFGLMTSAHNLHHCKIIKERYLSV